MDRNNQPIEIFISYSHIDDTIRDELVKHLCPLQRLSLIKCWHDRKIISGSNWENDIDEHLNKAEIILFIISSDFVASDYCYGIEMVRALERHNLGEACVIPIYARDIDFQGLPFAELQFLPQNGVPISQWTNRDQAWTEVAKALRKIVDDLIAKKLRIKKSYITIGSNRCTIDDFNIEMNVPPYVKAGLVYAPALYTALACGVDANNVLLDTDGKTMTLLKRDKVVQFKVGSNTVFINGEARDMDVSPEIVSGHIMLPATYIASALDVTAAWNQRLLSIEFTYS